VKLIKSKIEIKDERAAYNEELLVDWVSKTEEQEKDRRAMANTFKSQDLDQGYSNFKLSQVSKENNDDMENASGENATNNLRN
jgi:hypothetical protein